MRYENKSWKREGQVFSMGKGDSTKVDLSDVRILHAGVDTVKQLYKCCLMSEVTQLLESSKTGDFLDFGGFEWKFSRSSQTSGYQYILSNMDIGFVVLLKSFYVPAEDHGSHLKIEVSPFVIRENSPESLTKEIHKIARLFGRDLSASGVACHIAVDLKNMVVPDDFEKRFVCKARRSYKFSAISSIATADYDLSEVSAIYGDRQTFTYGRAASVQFCMYDKVAEAEKSDKLDFWRSVWSCVGGVDDPFESEYQDGDSVRRIELRFHHSVVDEFSRGTVNTLTGEVVELNIRDYRRLASHLTALFQYGLSIFRLQHSTSYVDPLWQLLLEDVRIIHQSPDLLYKRAKKTPGVSTRFNVRMWLANVARVAARRRLTVKHVSQCVLSFGLDAELADYFNVPLYGGDASLQMAVEGYFADKFKALTISGVAA